jgi:hypothetical protein
VICFKRPDRQTSNVCWCRSAIYRPYGIPVQVEAGGAVDVAAAQQVRRRAGPRRAQGAPTVLAMRGAR